MSKLAQLPDTVSKLVELRTHETDRRSAVAMTRLLLITTAVVYPVWWLFVQWLVPSFVDSLLERVVVGLVALVGALLTYTPRGERVALRIGEVVSFLIVGHFFTLVWRNQADVWASYGLLIILAGSNFSQLGVRATLRLTAWVGVLTAATLVELGPTGDALSMLGGAVAVQLMAGLGAWRRERADNDRAAHPRYALELFDQVLRALPEPVFLKDASGTILLVNNATADAFGMTVEQMMGKRLPDLIGPDAAASMTAMDRAVLANGVEQTFLQTLPNPAGGQRIWRLVLSKLHRGSSEPFLLGIASDLTELMRQDEALRKAKDAAEAGLRAKSEFLAKMSHEIRTPMNGVLLAIEVAKTNRHHLSAERLAELLSIAEVSAHGLLRIVDDVLDVSKMEAGQLRLEAADLDLHALLAGLERAYALQAEQKKLQWQVFVDPSVPQWVIGDALRLQQILGNLVSNALKFTDRGHVTVQVLALPAEAPQTVKLRFGVVDSGIGIAADKQAAVLQPFVQADDSTTRRYGGTGLGLSIVSQLLERMNSQLELQSQPGVGTLFQFVLTLPLGTAQERTGPDSTLLETQGQPRPDAPVVLAVDDNAVNLQMLVALLDRLGVPAHAVDNGRDAVDWALGWQPAAVLMDVQMPDLDGLQASRLLREKGYTGPIVAVTAQALQDDRERCLQAGMNAYLAKPVTALGLAAVLQEVGVRGPRAATPAQRDPDSVAPRVLSQRQVRAEIGDPALADKMVALFAADWPLLRESLLAETAPEALRATLHRLRGSLLHFGAHQLAVLAATLEATIDAGRPSGAADAVALATAVDAALAAWQSQDAGVQPTVEPASPLQA